MTAPKTENTGTDQAPPDEHLWLEEIYGEKPLDWVRAENALTEQFLESEDFAVMEQRILEVLDAADRIPGVTKRGEHYYNFWRDAQHPKGLWRRTSWESYRSQDPDWELLLDVDALAAAEGTEWVFAGSALLRPDYRLALLRLSPDGGDAVVVREFDVERRAFVDGGFHLPAAKTQVSWEDSDTVLVGTDFGPGTLTASSYPRTVRRLRRGQPLAAADLVFEVPAEHLMAVVQHDPTPGFERNIAVDVIDFYNSQVLLQTPSGFAPVPVPTDVQVDVHRNWLLFAPQTDWEHAGTTHPAGSLLAAPLAEFMAGVPTLTTVFTPDVRSSLSSYSWTRDHLLLTVLRDVASVILVADPAAGFATVPLDAGAPLQMFEVGAVDDEDEADGNDYWLTATGFLTPTTLFRGTVGGGTAAVKASPSYFNEAGYTVEQHFAVSADGTRVPYFQVSPRDLVLDGENPTLMNGYGGFLQALTPSYSGVYGRSWLERRSPAGRGGVYVLANIRGGGEYGPGWHRAALQQKRHRAFEDFAAIAQDLITRGVTRRERLAATGRSNGGLLMGNMLTQYPQLFGAISCGVPLLDMRRYTKLSAGASWIAEYGDPDDPAQWEFIRTFSPYHQLRAGAGYPPVLIWTATSDDRVGPVQARKMAARMKALGIGGVWFHEALDGGHAGASDNKQSARMYAHSQEFLWKTVTA